MAIVDNSMLGKDSTYVDRYSPELLFPIARNESRASLGLNEQDLPFGGEDVWTSFEVSWLNSGGKPQVAIAVFKIPCDSTNIIESKSFKLYLNSFNQERLASQSAFISILEKDLSAAAGASVTVVLEALRSARQAISEPDGVCIDDIDASDFSYGQDASLLRLEGGSEEEVDETLYSDLLRSNCPVTNQPDWGSVVIRYKGPKINHESLLRYIVSFRQCQDFHEHCAEQIFCDLMKQCSCRSLSVLARYTRRGGLDINPYRATPDQNQNSPDTRFIRQ
jgi:7-cyano-7-deazaguanine reductase